MGLIAESEEANAQPLLGDLYYVERALGPYAELRHGDATKLLQREIAVLIMADVGLLPQETVAKLNTWVDKGGVLVRFAGPKLAQNADSLLPVHLRSGDRQLGGAMSWASPAHLAPSPPTVPSRAGRPAGGAGRPPGLAEPELDLGKKTWARLVDGTPLVTAEKQGNGWIVLIHTTAVRAGRTSPFRALRRCAAPGLPQPCLGGGAAASPCRRSSFSTAMAGYRPAADSAARHAQRPRHHAVGPRHPPGYYGKTTARRAHPAARSKLAPLAGLPAR